MKMKIIALFLLVTLNAFSQITTNPNFPKDTINGIFAEFVTSKGNIRAILDYKHNPIAVANFITLAEGTNKYITDKKLKGIPFYDGLKFHIVVKDFMIQSGDRSGKGDGNAGYVVREKQTEKVRYDFDQGGFLAMNNDEHSTSEFSSQFIITHRNTDWYKGEKTAFGFVISNLEVVKSIEQNDLLKKVKITRVGDEAKSFDAIKTLDSYMTTVKPIEDEEIAQKKKIQQEKYAKIREEKEKEKMEARLAMEAKQSTAKAEKVIYFKTMKTKAITTPSGLKYVITTKGTGGKPTKGQTIKIYYAEYLTDGFLSSTNFIDVAKQYNIYNPKDKYEPFPYELGQKDALLPGILEGISKMSIGDQILLFIPSKLAYGKEGSGENVKPNTDVIFEIKIVK